MRLQGLHHITMITGDAQGTLAFYGDVLGLTVKENYDEWAELELDGLTIGLNARDSEQPGGEGGAVVAFRPQGSIEDAVEVLSGQGVDFAGGITEHPWGRVAAFHDPDGNVLELYEPPQG